jgi:hypothetical protein
MRRLLLLLALPVLAAACGGSSDGSETAAQPPPGAPGTLRATLAATPGPDVGLLLGTSDFAVGDNRISFLVVDNQGRVIESPTAKVLVAPKSLDEKPTQSATAQLRVLDPLPASNPNAVRNLPEPDTKALYVTNVRFDEAGRYWLVAQPRGKPIQAMAVIDVKDEPTAPGVGDKAIAIANPTLGTLPIAKLTTATPPDRELLRDTVKDSLAKHVPFVVVFATPKWCSSRTCGPTVEIVDTVRRRFESKGVRFIHVEVYTDNDPTKGYNEWFREWHLPTEPWIFVVDSDGVIRSRFEGSASVEELADAVRQVVP